MDFDFAQALDAAHYILEHEPALWYAPSDADSTIGV